MLLGDYTLLQPVVHKFMIIYKVRLFAGMSTFGTDFILMFIAINSEEPGPPELIFTTLESSDVDVTVEVPSLSYKRPLTGRWIVRKLS